MIYDYTWEDGGRPFWDKAGFDGPRQAVQFYFAKLPIVQWMDNFPGVEGDKLFWGFWEERADRILDASDMEELVESLEREAKIYFGRPPCEDN